jgi:succinate-acetate transporter protein
VALLLVLAFLFLTYLLLTIGELAGGNRAALTIGGWLGIICALVAWYTALAEILSTANSVFRLPMGQIG